MVVRIDARRGRLPGVRSGITAPSGRNELTPLASGLAAVGGALEQRRAQREREEGDRRARENKVALGVSTAQLTQELARDFNDRSGQYDGSKPGFSDMIEKDYRQKIDELVAVEPEDRKADARLRYEGVLNQYVLSAINLEDQRRDAHVLKSGEAWLQQSRNAIASDPALYFALKDQRTDIVDAMPAGVQQKLDQEYRGELARSYVAARIEDDPQGALEELQSGALDADLGAGGKGARNDKQQLLNTARAELERRAREAERAAEKQIGVADKAVDAELRDVEKAMALGAPVSDDRIERLLSVAGQASDETATRAREAVAVFKSAAAIYEMPLSVSERNIAQERARLREKGDTSGFEARRLEAVEKARAGMERRINSDLVGFAIERGAIEPLDLTQIDPQSIQERAAIAKEAADFYGAPVQYFSDNERAALARVYDSDPQAGLALATAIASAPDGLAALGEISKKAPVMAHLGGLVSAGTSRRFVEDATSGAQLLATPGHVPALGGKRADTQPIEAELLQGFMLFPQQGLSAIETARAAYEARAARHGWAENFKAKEFDRALQEAAGFHVDASGMERGGFQKYSAGGETVRTLLPTWMENGRLDNYIKRLDKDDFALAGGAGFDDGGREIPARIMRKALPVAVGGGRYRLALSNPAQDADWVLNAAGQPYVLDLNVLRQSRGDGPAVETIADLQRALAQ